MEQSEFKQPVHGIQNDPSLLNKIQQITNLFVQQFPKSEYLSISQFQQIFNEFKIQNQGADPIFIANIVYFGWMCFASCNQMMPKLHIERSILNLGPWDLIQFYKNLKNHKGISLKSLKRAIKQIDLSNYIICINKNIEETFKILDKYQKQKNGCNWIHKSLQNALKKLAEQPVIINNCVVQVFAWELRTKDKNQLVSGDLGYQYGQIYVSMSGFTNTKYSSYGIIQLLAQGCLLKQQNIKLWDFGMQMEYKISLGAVSVKRNGFLKFVEMFRNNQTQLNFDTVTLNEINQINQLVEYVKALEQKENQQRLLQKLSKRVPSHLKELEKKQLIQNWDFNQIQNWISVKFKLEIQNINGNQIMEYLNTISSRQKRNKIKKAIMKLELKQKNKYKI